MVKSVRKAKLAQEPQRVTATCSRPHTHRLLRDMRDYHGFDYQEYCFLGSYARRNLILKLESIGFEGTSVHLYQIAWCHTPQKNGTGYANISALLSSVLRRLTLNFVNTEPTNSMTIFCITNGKYIL
jgi:hypothetical protein